MRAGSEKNWHREQESVNDAPRDHCGVVGIHAPGEDAARLAFFALFALQHRGQESAGIATSNLERLRIHTAMGLVTQAFAEDDLEKLSGHLAIGHTRYSTTGSDKLNNAQPFLATGPHGDIALGHNGNLINATSLKEEVSIEAISFQGSTDSEIITHLLAQAPGKDWGERIAFVMRRLEGAYCLTLLTPDGVIGVRDPLGIHPLSIGKLNGNGWVIASETCALDHLGATFVRDVEPGEAVLLTNDGPKVLYQNSAKTETALCSFEYIYLARPDSNISGRLVYSTRQAMGRQLAIEHPANADVVIGVPDSASAAASGFAEQSSLPYKDGLIKNRYVGRTFIEPRQRIRDLGVRLKFNPMPEIIKGNRVVLVDDSIVRGTTTPHVVELLRRAGATEVHLRVSSPPIQHPCFFGVDMGPRKDLVAASRSVEEVRSFTGADSIGYLSIEGLMTSIGGKHNGFCGACFTGEYPIPVQLEMDKLALEN